jgi:hypothetical protein
MRMRTIFLRDNRTILIPNKAMYTEFMVIFLETYSNFRVKQIGVEDASVY